MFQRAQCMSLDVQYPREPLQDGGQEFKQLDVTYVLDEGHLRGGGGRRASGGRNLGGLMGGASRQNIVKVCVSLWGIY